MHGDCLCTQNPRPTVDSEADARATAAKVNLEAGCVGKCMVDSEGVCAAIACAS